MSQPRHVGEILRELFPAAATNGSAPEEKENSEVEPSQEEQSDD